MAKARATRTATIHYCGWCQITTRHAIQNGISSCVRCGRTKQPTTGARKTVG